MQSVNESINDSIMNDANVSKIVENDGGQIRFHFCLCLIKRFTRNICCLHRYKKKWLSYKTIHITQWIRWSTFLFMLSKRWIGVWRWRKIADQVGADYRLLWGPHGLHHVSPYHCGRRDALWRYDVFGCIAFRQSRFAKPRFTNALTTLGLVLGLCTLNHNSRLARLDNSAVCTGEMRLGEMRLGEMRLGETTRHRCVQVQHCHSTLCFSSFYVADPW